MQETVKEKKATSILIYSPKKRKKKNSIQGINNKKEIQK